MKLDRLVGTYTLDINKAGMNDIDLLDPSSSSDEYVSDDDGEIEDNLTEPW